jgi:o-succinylbenzoate synthase
MLQAAYKKHTLNFKHPGGTSRGILTRKDSWFLFIYSTDDPSVRGIGECSIIKGLSIDDRSDFDEMMNHVCININNWQYLLEEGLKEFPSIRFGLETAIKDFVEGGSRLLFKSDFTNGIDSIPINGLIWMGDYIEMKNRIIEKIESGYRCIKLKIGAINFEDEIKLLKQIRADFTSEDLELRLDANGAFKPKEAREKLQILSDYDIHSIEQPIKARQWLAMAEICDNPSIPIALDEELIGIDDHMELSKMLDELNPQYIILKPSLIGGLSKSNSFIREADNRNIGWWVTSALEGNIGLNAIAQWTYTLNNSLPQGLGTGQLFKNNIDSPLIIENANLKYDNKRNWNFNLITNDLS